MIPASPEDDLTYLPFTGPARRDKELHTLQIILEGLAMDGLVNGLKIEKAIGNRKTGCPILIVREAAFLDAAQN